MFDVNFVDLNKQYTSQIDNDANNNDNNNNDNNNNNNNISPNVTNFINEANIIYYTLYDTYKELTYIYTNSLQFMNNELLYIAEEYESNVNAYNYIFFNDKTHSYTFDIIISVLLSLLFFDENSKNDTYFGVFIDELLKISFVDEHYKENLLKSFEIIKNKSRDDAKQYIHTKHPPLSSYTNNICVFLFNKYVFFKFDDKK